MGQCKGLRLMQWKELGGRGKPTLRKDFNLVKIITLFKVLTNAEENKNLLLIELSDG